MEKDRRILILSPHTDDAEIACGGSIAKWKKEGHEIRVMVFSSAKQSLRERGLPENTTSKECRNAFHVLGITQYSTFDYQVRKFAAKRQEILNDLIEEGNKFMPNLVVMPSSKDIHQDHNTIYEEGKRAFKHVSLIGYEMPQNNTAFPNTLFVRLNDYHVEKKMEAINEYVSQKERPYIKDEFAKNLARVRGVQAGSEYAEAFEVLRWVI